MYSSFEKLWLESMSVNKSNPERQSKLRTYSKLKNKLIFEPYLEKIKIKYIINALASQDSESMPII